ncbi:MAG: ribosome small subunit-dependent GTPase A [Oscillospiraceae bacterium]|nr:ribosome small subunit-dependent GTPase A [Oscillospiraceae bacterium]
MTGRIVRTVSGFYTVDTGAEAIVCHARGILRKRGVAPLAGDFVKISRNADGTGSITEVEERRNMLTRPPIANIDILLLVLSEATPKTDAFVIDKMAAMAAWREIGVLMFVNKCDLAPGDTLLGVYKAAGFPVIKGSALTGEGIEDLWPLIAGKCIALAGNTGVGKSALLNVLDGSEKHKTGEVSERLGRGRHTTRHVELVRLKNGVLVADTPGFSALDMFERIPATELGGCFVDFRPYLGRCRFSGCLHGTGQKDCAVREAAEAGAIGSSRYESYLRLLGETMQL